MLQLLACQKAADYLRLYMRTLDKKRNDCGSHNLLEA